jgi:hypothetical protein
MNLSTCTLEQLIEAERVAIKYTPKLALMISCEIYSRKEWQSRAKLERHT